MQLCLRASQPLLVALRIVDGDETPIDPKIMVAMDVAKAIIKESLKDKPILLNEVLKYYDNRDIDIAANLIYHLEWVIIANFQLNS